jgi:hypothetical protein
MFFLYVPIVLSFLLAAAHWLHAGNFPMVLISLLVPLLLLVRNGWVVRVVQVMLFLMAFEWLRTMVVLIQEKQAEEMSWTRTAIIMGSVTLFTIASGLVFAAPPLRRRYFAPKMCSLS